MRTSDRIPPEHWPDCIGLNEWYFPFEQTPDQEPEKAGPQAGNEFWPEYDPSAFPYFAYQLERPM